jgi:hypothetical protein
MHFGLKLGARAVAGLRRRIGAKGAELVQFICEAPLVGFSRGTQIRIACFARAKQAQLRRFASPPPKLRKALNIRRIWSTAIGVFLP